VVDFDPGAYIFRVTYEPGDSGGTICSQAHIWVTAF
jgi:hypothetical protein